MNTISDSCKENITNINVMVNRAVKEIKIANARAESAEKMLEELRITAQNEIKNAYAEGYKKGLESKSSNDGGTSKSKDDTKLVLKNN